MSGPRSPFLQPGKTSSSQTTSGCAKSYNQADAESGQSVTDPHAGGEVSFRSGLVTRAYIRDRHTAERAGWRAELKALDKIRVDEIAAGTRPNKSLQIDVGYHQELEAANKRLEMDNRLMAPRVCISSG